MNADESDSLQSAAAMLAGLPLATVDFKPFDLSRLGEKGVHAGLSGALKRARSPRPWPLKDNHQYIIFSDHHRGTREGNDDFQYCEDTYGRALQHYWDAGYSLIILGDGEECLEDDPGEILDAYSSIFDLEARFHKAGRYIRISGNHDAIWESEAMVRQHLHGKFPGLRVNEGVVFHYTSPNRQPGDLFLVHGHQGTLDSVYLKPLSRPFLHNIYRPYQQIAGGGRTGPATNIALRAAHDTQIYRWARKQRDLIVIAGHTHRPVWGSRTHLEKLIGELNQLLDRSLESDLLTRFRALEETVRQLVVSSMEQGNNQQVVDEQNAWTELRKGAEELLRLLQPEPSTANLRQLLGDWGMPTKANQIPWEQVKNKVKEIKEREYKYPSGGDSIKTEPCYFNTGCCRFRDGDITGIELAEGKIRLIRWGKGVDDPKWRILEEASLDSIFRLLKLTRSGVWELGK